MPRSIPVLFLAAAVALAALLIPALPAASQEVSVPELTDYEVLSAALAHRTVPGLVLLDVRTRDEYKAGHIPGSYSVPWDYIGEKFHDQSKIAYDAYILLIGKPASSDVRKAKGMLQALNYTNVHIFGSITKWKGPLQ